MIKQNTDVTHKFHINGVKIINIFYKKWKYYEIDIDQWDDKYFDKITSIRREINHPNILVENQGRYLVFIPINELKHEELDSVKKEFTEKLRSEIRNDIQLTKIEIENEEMIVDDNKILEVTKKGIGEIITHKLFEKNFTKIESKGGVGVFLPPDEFQSIIEIQKNLDEIKFSHCFTLSIGIPGLDKEGRLSAFLFADVKTEIKGKESLEEVRRRNINKKNEDWRQENKIWRLCKEEDIIKRIYPKEAFIERFELQNIINLAELGDVNFGFGKNKSEILTHIYEKGGYHLSKEESIAVLKTKGKVYKDTNREYYIPCKFLEKSISPGSLKDKGYINEYKKFSQLDTRKRFHLVKSLFNILAEEKIVQLIEPLNSFSIPFAYPSVKDHQETRFGTIPNLKEYGVEEWGNLEKVVICKIPNYETKSLDEEFQNKVEEYFKEVKRKTDGNYGEIIVETRKDLSSVDKIVGFLNQLNAKEREKICIIVILGKKNRKKNYEKLKSQLTHELKTAIQVIRVETIKKKYLARIVKTIFPQIIAKTGGLAYKLAPTILDKAIIIGLDKGRDSHSTAPSASAGVAAVTPEGRYVAGASTGLTKTTDDFIDVDEIADELLEKAVKKYPDLEYIVFLRDGSPDTCKEEVKRWKKYINKYNLKFVFFSSRKSNFYRLFPSDVDKMSSKEQNYKLPLVLNSDPLPENEFLVVSAKAIRGTPKPVLYTLMENTTDFDKKTIIEKVIAQVISTSMLSWESPFPTSQPLPLHYADKLAAFVQIVKQKWSSSNEKPMFI